MGTPKRGETAKTKGSTAVALAITSAVAVIAVTGIVLYFYRDILKDAGQRSTIGGCLNDAFQSSRDTKAPISFTDGKFPLPSVDMHVRVESTLPDDLRQFSFVAAVCCGEVGQDIAGCAQALRAFVETHPDASQAVANDAPAIKNVAAVIAEAPAPLHAPDPSASSGEARPTGVQAIIDEPDPATQMRRAYEVLATDDDVVRADALRRFYSGPSPALRRIAIIYLVEQTKGGKRKLVIDASAPKSDAAGSGNAEEVTRLVRALTGKTLHVSEIDRVTGGFQGRLGSTACNGTIGETQTSLSTPFAQIKLAPHDERPALVGTLTDNQGTQAAIEVPLM